MDDVDINATFNALRSQEPPTLRELRSFETHLGTERAKYLSKLIECINQIKDKLETLKSEVHDDFKMEIRDAEYYRVNMFQLEGKITKLKQFIKFELCNLLKEEIEITKDLQTVERRVDEWNKPLNVQSLKPIISAYNFTANSDENDPTSEFQRFLASCGGHTGGWDEQDHQLFLRERRKHNGKPKFINIVHSFLPDISEEEISAHERWHMKYEELKKLQKEAIRKWRAGRQCSLDKRQDSSQDEVGSGEIPRPRTYAGQRDITERIKEWKRQQQLKKADEEERQREEQQRQLEERLRKRDAHKSKKAAVEKYKAEKINKVQDAILTQQMRDLQVLEDRAKKNVLMRAFRDQDQQYVEKKKMQKLQAELKERRKAERIRKMKRSIEIERDPQRVLQPTQVWANRCSYQEDYVNMPQTLGIHAIQHLAVPNWRRGIDHTQTL